MRQVKKVHFFNGSLLLFARVSQGAIFCEQHFTSCVNKMSRSAVLLNDVMSYQVYPLVALAKALLLRSVSEHCRSLVKYGAPSRFVDVAVGRAVTYEDGYDLDLESRDSGDILSIHEARLAVVDEAVLCNEAVRQRAVEVLCAHGNIVAFKAPEWLMYEQRPGAPDGGPAVTLIKRCGATLLSLDVSHGGFAVDDTTIKDVAANCGVLKSFNARNCTAVSDAGLAHLCPDLQPGAGLAHLSRLNSLTTLNLTCCEAITDAGLAHLSRLNSLTTLNLGGCTAITDAGLAHLSRLNSLTTLNLWNCTAITDAGLAHLRPDSRGLRNSTERDASPGGG